MIGTNLHLTQYLKFDNILLLKTKVFCALIIAHEIPDSLSVLVCLLIHTSLPIGFHPENEGLKLKLPKNQFITREGIGCVICTRIYQIEFLIVLDQLNDTRLNLYWILQISINTIHHTIKYRIFITILCRGTLIFIGRHLIRQSPRLVLLKILQSLILQFK